MTHFGILAEKAKIITRMIEEVTEYWDKFQRPMPLKIVAAKFGKASRAVGGFHELVKELENDGSLVVDLQESGRKLVYPPDAGARRMLA